MKFLFVCCFCFLLSRGVCSAQDSVWVKSDKIVKAAVKALQAKNVQEIVVYYIDEPGIWTRVYHDTCVVQNIKFVFWKKGKNCFLQRFDECFKYEETAINPALFNLIHLQFKEIENANSLFAGDHGYFATFEIYNGEEQIYKQLDTLVLDSAFAKHSEFSKQNYIEGQKSILFKLFVTTQVAS